MSFSPTTPPLGRERERDHYSIGGQEIYLGEDLAGCHQDPLTGGPPSRPPFGDELYLVSFLLLSIYLVDLVCLIV